MGLETVDMLWEETSEVNSNRKQNKTNTSKNARFHCYRAKLRKCDTSCWGGGDLGSIETKEGSLHCESKERNTFKNTL